MAQSIGRATIAQFSVGTVLVVDDSPSLVRLLEVLLVAEGHTVLKAHDGEEALAMITGQHLDAVLMDVRMPKLDGFEVCRHVKLDAAIRLIPVILMTGLTETQDRIRAIEAGADDFLTKPVDAQELKARVGSLIRLKRHTDDLDSAESIILSLAQTVEVRDPCTDGHCQRLASYATALGRKLQLPEEDLAALRRGGYLHDVGKIAIPDAILMKPGRLTADEFEKMKEHTVVGDRLCGNLRVLQRVRPIVRHRHERLDGSGYPDGLRGDAIPLLAQITGIVDVYDAITTARPYKAALPADVAFEQLEGEVDRGWRRSDLVATFVTAARAGEIGQSGESVR